MKLNFTQRLLLGFSAYTLIVMLLMIFIGWQAFEIYENKSEQSLLTQAGLISMEIEQEAKARPSIISEDYKLYLPPNRPYFWSRVPKTAGVHKLNGLPAVYYGEHPVSHAPFYIVFGDYSPIKSFSSRPGDVIEVLAIALLATLIAVTGMWMLIKRLAAPVITLKHHVDQLTMDTQTFAVLDRDDEVGNLSKAFSQMWQRVRSFMRREQEFTRFASHELRSPVTVIQGNIELIKNQLEPTPLNRRVLKRLETATRRMTLLINCFLWLGREENTDREQKRHINKDEFSRLLRELFLGFSHQEQARFDTDIGDISWYLRPNMLSIIFDNLLRNALKHSGSRISITAQDNRLLINNLVLSVNHDVTSHRGIGLQIVAKICETEKWDFETTATDREFTACVTLPADSP